MDFLSELNPSQRAAVAATDGPSLIIAGAGSGKTRVLTYKIAHLLQLGIPANRILALTFTNKAAKEMKDRIGQLVSSQEARYLWMGTFHSICMRILKQEATTLGYTKDFSVYDTADVKSLIKQVLKTLNLDDKVYKPAMALSRISRAKSELIDPDGYGYNDAFTKADKVARLYEMPRVYQLYQQRLRNANAMDFDDLLMCTCRLFQEEKDILARYQEIFQYVLVDEYQDTNYAQYILVKNLAMPENNVCVVGDDAQSIYSFRGADIRNILSFQQEYPKAQLFKLERNYRSTQKIVQAANSLIHHNSHQIHKDVYSENTVGEPILLQSYMSDREEGDGVAHQIQRLKGTFHYDEMAILYRTNAQSRTFENSLRLLNIPYRIYGGTSFYQRKEIKDAISYFRLSVNPRDDEALLRVINFPARGIGDVTITKMQNTANAHHCSLLDVVSAPEHYELAVSAPMRNRLVQFATLIKRFSELSETLDAYAFADVVLRESGVSTASAMDRTQEGIDRKQNLDELLSSIHYFVEQRQQEDIAFTPVQDFLAEVSLLTDQDEKLTDETPRVTLMTVHAAKGLEYKAVFVVGLEENLFPSQFSDSPAEIEEERRLLYVAITRAEERCFLTYAKSRFKNGTVNFSSPSRFLREIDKFSLSRQTSSVSTYWGTTPSDNRPSEDSPSPRASSSRKLVPIASSGTAEQRVAIDSEWKVGDRVHHRVFGDGMVLSVYKDSGNEKIDIQFVQSGKKTLLLTFAKLERIEK